MTWEPGTATKLAVQDFAKALLSALPALLGVNEIIGGCELIDVDPYGVGVAIIPRWVRVSIYEYHQDVWYSGSIGLTVGDYYTILHNRTGDRYEIMGPSGTGGSSGGGWVGPASTFERIVVDTITNEVVIDSVTGEVVWI